MKILIIKNGKTIGNYKSISTAGNALKLLGFSSNQSEIKLANIEENKENRIFV